jgi:hypothetical protein
MRLSVNDILRQLHLSSSYTERNRSGEEVLPVGGFSDSVTMCREFVVSRTCSLERALYILYIRPVQRGAGALFYSAGFNVNQNFKEKIYLNNSMFHFLS